MADWYYAKNGKQNGPITSAQLRQMAQSGEIGPEDLVFKEGGSNWIAASTVPGLIPSGGGGGGRVAPQQKPQPQAGGGQGFEFDSAGGGGRGGRDEEDDRPTVRKPAKGGSYWGDMLMFRRMIAPTIIIILFWLGVIMTLVGALFGMIGGLFAMINNQALYGLVVIVVSILSIPFNILVLRLYCELMIVVFRINENLLDIKEVAQRHVK